MTPQTRQLLGHVEAIGGDDDLLMQTRLVDEPGLLLQLLGPFPQALSNRLLNQRGPRLELLHRCSDGVETRSQLALEGRALGDAHRLRSRDGLIDGREESRIQALGRELVLLQAGDTGQGEQGDDIQLSTDSIRPSQGFCRPHVLLGEIEIDLQLCVDAATGLEADGNLHLAAPESDPGGLS